MFPYKTVCKSDINVVNKSTKLSKVGVSLQCFTADFSQFSSTTIEMWLLTGRLGPCHQFKAFQGFSWNFLFKAFQGIS